MTDFWRKMEEKRHLDSLDATLRSVGRDTRPKTMSWIEIDRNNLPKGEVLCFADSLFMVGKIDAYNNILRCTADSDCIFYIEDVTHFIDIHNFKPKINQ
jgi:hypothetical protein